MLLPKRDGIICDMCSDISKDDFKYHSYDFRSVRVHDNRMDPIEFRNASDNTLDVCENCHGKIKKLVMKFHKASPCKPIRHYHTGITCDITGSRLSGSYSFKHCDIADVTVKMSHKPYICMECKKPVKDAETGCETCENSETAKNADVNTLERALEIWMCLEAHDVIMEKVKKSKEKRKDNLWTTKPS